MNTEELVDKGILTQAKLPSGNGLLLEQLQRVVLPLTAKDYPAATSLFWNEAIIRCYLGGVGVIMYVVNPDDLFVVLDVLREDSKYIGGGVAVGLKDITPPLLDELDPMAKAIGSVNFIKKMESGALKGFNSDGEGYVTGLERYLEVNGKNSLEGRRILILGAGGTSAPIAFALVACGAEIVILNRTVSKAEVIGKRVNEFFGGEHASFGGEERIPEEAKRARVIINTSTKGAEGAFKEYAALAPASDDPEANLEASRKVLQSLSPDTLISDVSLVKGGKVTTLKLAEEVGFSVLDGMPMVVYQGVKSFMNLHGEEVRKNGFTEADVERIMLQKMGLT